MNLTFERWCDPNDLVGLDPENGIDPEIIPTVVRACVRTVIEGRQVSPFDRALQALRHLFQDDVDSRSSEELSTAAFRLFFLDLLSECRFAE